MKNVLKRENVVKLYNVFESLKEKKCNIKFAYFIVKNKKLLKNEIDILTEISEPSHEYKEYEAKRVQLASQLADKDENGNIKIKDNSFVITGNNIKQFQQDIEILKKQYHEAIDQYQKNINQYQKMLEEEICIKGLHQIKLNDIIEDIEPNILELFIDCELIID